MKLFMFDILVRVARISIIALFLLFCIAIDICFMNFLWEHISHDLVVGLSPILFAAGLFIFPILLWILTGIRFCVIELDFIKQTTRGDIYILKTIFE